MISPVEVVTIAKADVLGEPPVYSNEAGMTLISIIKWSK